MAGLIDVLIPYASAASKNGGSELRYALRSIQSFLPNLGRVFVATDNPPDWLKDVEIVPVPDTHTSNKDANLFDKILRVCQTTDISERFLIWSDDQVALQPIDIDKLNIYNVRTRNDFTRKSSKWARRMVHTFDYLREQGIEISNNWDSHTPHLYNKCDVVRILTSCNYINAPGYCLDTLLSGLSRKTPDIKQDDVKYTAESAEQAQTWTQSNNSTGYSWLGYDDRGFENGVNEWLNAKFPTLSRFEKNPEIDVVITYVDPTDPIWQQGFEKTTGIKQPERHCRYRSFDNLQYIFRGIESFMPWVHRVFLIVQQESQLPVWLNCRHSKLRIIYHNQFVPQELLPTFNTNVIELFLHRIKGLSEHFINFNDDMFPMLEMSPDCFFDERGFARISHKPRKQKRTNQFQIMLNNNERLLKEKYQMTHGYHNDHLPYALLKSAMKEVIDNNLDKVMNSLTDSPSRTDKNYTLHLVKNYILHISKAAYPMIRGKRVNLEDGSEVKKYPYEQIVCYNDNPKLNADFERVKKALSKVLNDTLPNKSKFECEDNNMGCGCKKKKFLPMIKQSVSTDDASNSSDADDRPAANDPIIQRRFWDSIKAYAAATIEWLAAGKPTRTKEEMQERFEVCQVCPYFINIEENKRGRCAMCGCYLGVNPHRLLQGNKIAMKTQHCPDDRWD